MDGSSGHRDLLSLTPREIVAELDRHVVGQAKAKRAVALALRERWRRNRLPPEQQKEILPKNILMIGPTGVGKTEIARRLARLAGSPFVKVEASKYTEVGYVGRDVESIVRDLVEAAISLVRSEMRDRVRGEAEQAAEDRLVDLLAPAGASPAEKDRTRAMLRVGTFDDREVEIDVAEPPRSPFGVLAGPGMEDMELRLSEMLSGLAGPRGRTRRSKKTSEARRALQEEEEAKRIDEGRVTELALERAESNGIVFIDEIDKVAGREGARGPDVSREGVQRDLLPIVEGTQVRTKHGTIRTDQVLFIAAGAFHVSKPSDLIPELQGRFPIRVELAPLDEEALVRILTEPENAPLGQVQALLATEGVSVRFDEGAVREIAATAARVNRTLENIGARRLATVLERLLEEVSFDAPDRGGQEILFDAPLVRSKLAGLAEDRDLSRYVL
jgi:ATP-dependent HslUV protease ATP-binding subunit HslU